MRSRLFKSLMATLLALVMLGAPLTVSASAQYEPRPPSPLLCEQVPPPTLSLDGFTVVTTYPEIYLQCVVRIVIEVNPVLYDGPVLATRVHRNDLPPLAPGEHTITATATTVFGEDLVAELKLSAAEVAAINALIAAAGGGTYQNPSVPADGDSIPVGSGQGFATTGSNVSLPIAIGVTLVGAGGIALAIARRRQQEETAPQLV